MERWRPKQPTRSTRADLLRCRRLVDWFGTGTFR